MVPIHDTDLDDRRWEELSWKNFELWEKVEVQQKKKRNLWIISTVIVFLAFSSVSVVMQESGKWQTLIASRALAQEISKIKTQALIQKQAFRIRFTGPTSLHYIVERGDRCASKEFAVEREGTLVQEYADSLKLLGAEEANRFSMSGFIETFCYDPLEGNPDAEGEHPLVFGLGSVKDLTNNNLDHLSVVLLRGRSAEISFE